MRCANGWNGVPDRAPFDVIHVGAGASSLPNALMQELKVGNDALHMKITLPIPQKYKCSIKNNDNAICFCICAFADIRSEEE